MAIFTREIVTLSQAQATLSELADEVKADAEKMITQNGESDVAIIAAQRLPLRQASCRLKFSILGVESEDNVKDEQENLYG